MRLQIEPEHLRYSSKTDMVKWMFKFDFARVITTEVFVNNPFVFIAPAKKMGKSNAAFCDLTLLCVTYYTD